MTTSPAERDPQALTDRDGLAKVIRGAMMTAYEDGKGGWLFRASTAHEIADAVLSARPAATTDTAVREVIDRYFDLDADPWQDEGALPEPEDVWRFHRDIKAVLDPGTRTAHHDTGHHGEGA